jgi:hypothetical protein
MRIKGKKSGKEEKRRRGKGKRGKGKRGKGKRGKEEIRGKKGK